MFWADEIKEAAKQRYADKIRNGKPLVIRDEKTLSGRVHVGSLRGVVIHGAVADVLRADKVPQSFLFELNDFDPMDGLPVYLDETVYKKYLGMPLCNVPSPDGKAKNYAEYYGNEFQGVITDIGYKPEFYRSSDVYRSGRYDKYIRLALEKADVIRAIYKEVSGSQKDQTWSPVQVICDGCGKVSTTSISSFDGEKVTYSCGNLEWTTGCGHTGIKSPFKGGSKLPWKVEWAAKFSVFDVDIEGGGKDHSTRGGSREIADAISRKVFDREPPINIPYEFFNIGGKKMSSSKGRGAYSRDIADLLPPHILRLLMLQKPPQRVVDFIPDGDSVPILYDAYDTLAKAYFAGGKEIEAVLFPLIHFGDIKELTEERFLPRFSEIAYLVQMPHIDVLKEVEKQKGSPLTKLDKEEIEIRTRYAKVWLDTYAPEDYKFEIQESVPAAAKNLSTGQKDAIRRVLEYIKSQKVLNGQELHTQLHEIRKQTAIEPKLFFEAFYISLLNKTSGPKAGWFISVLDRKFVEKRLEEVSR